MSEMLEFETKQDIFGLFEEITLLITQKTISKEKFPKLFEFREALQKKADKGEI